MLRYLGSGEFIPGVPARDLTDAEATRFRLPIAEHWRNTGRELYGPPIEVEPEEPAQPEPEEPARPRPRRSAGVQE